MLECMNSYNATLLRNIMCANGYFLLQVSASSTSVFIRRHAAPWVSCLVFYMHSPDRRTSVVCK